MKSATDPRHLKRRTVVRELFAYSFAKQKVSSETEEIAKNFSSIDEEISNAAPAWPIDKLNKVDLAILRLAVFELKQKSAPPKVIIDEAVELAKEMGSESSSSFVNGVLGTILEKEEKGVQRSI